MTENIEIIFHNAEELKIELDKIEKEVENRHNLMEFNLVYVVGASTDVENGKFIIKDLDGNIRSEIDPMKIFSFKIFSDDDSDKHPLDDHDYSYHFINHKLQFYEEEYRDYGGFDALKDDSSDDVFIPDELAKEVEKHLQKGRGILDFPVDFDDMNISKGDILTEEDFIRLIYLHMKSRK